MRQLPESKEVFEGEIAYYWLEDGILYSLSKNTKRTVENITGNISLIHRITGNTKMPLLVHLTQSAVPDKATRVLSAKELPNLYTAMAMVSD